MATLTPKKVTLSEINDGNEFVQGAGILSSAVNAPLEASAYSQIFAEGVSQAPDVSEAGNVGTPSVSFVDGSTVDGVVTKKLKFSNLKGATGATGPTGPSATVINDLTTGGTAVALSAEQGKILNTNKESLSNKVTILSEESTDEEYPSAKVTYDSIQDVVIGSGIEDNNPYELVSSGSFSNTGLNLTNILEIGNDYLLRLSTNTSTFATFTSSGTESWASKSQDFGSQSFSTSTVSIPIPVNCASGNSSSPIRLSYTQSDLYRTYGMDFTFSTTRTGRVYRWIDLRTGASDTITVTPYISGTTISYLLYKCK